MGSDPSESRDPQGPLDLLHRHTRCSCDLDVVRRYATGDPVTPRESSITAAPEPILGRTGRPGGDGDRRYANTVVVHGFDGDQGASAQDHVELALAVDDDVLESLPRELVGRLFDTDLVSTPG